MIKRTEKPGKKKGAALLVAILLSAIIGTAAIGVSAVALRQVSISETYSNGLVAYYAAESGLEEGLLRYKFDKDIQIPKVIGDETSDSATLSRTPKNANRNFLENDVMHTSDDNGVPLGYGPRNREQVYDLQAYYKQNYFGDDTVAPIGVLNNLDVQAYTSGSPYQINKDESKVFSILGTGPDNKIFLYWKWRTACVAGERKAVEIKIKTKEINPISKKNEYTGLFRNSSCGTIDNATDATPMAGGVYSVSASGDVKSALGISSMTAIEMTIKPVETVNNAGDGIYFGFDQGDIGGGQTSSLETTIKSVGYFSGASKEIVANIDRQTGTILDIFQYVIYKGQ